MQRVIGFDGSMENIEWRANTLPYNGSNDSSGDGRDVRNPEIMSITVTAPHSNGQRLERNIYVDDAPIFHR